MKLLFTLDDMNYADSFPVIKKHVVRAVIMRDGLIASQRSGIGEYKLPGGGMEAGETMLDALVREVREETGLLVKTDTVKEIGEIIEKREDIFEKGKLYEAHSCYFECDCSDETVELAMTASEIEAGFSFQWVKPDVFISENERVMKEKWKLRDTLFLKKYLTGGK